MEDKTTLEKTETANRNPHSFEGIRPKKRLPHQAAAGKWGRCGPLG
ncbi:hypothetical protein DES41_111107 [Pseudorhodoferax soli]|uniref:Uncharacterized protein n=1 Tax=Pseudorhodoferax soli TaxID=545864 RepID=A0A368XES4_9BURK|nr:hypothetical protein DES41_111107 [Pseudorhodoferax soli]